MKRLARIASVLLLALGFVGCGNRGGDETADSGKETPAVLTAEARGVLDGVRRALDAGRDPGTISSLEAFAECEGPSGEYLTRVVSTRDGRLRFEQRHPDGNTFLAGISGDGGWTFDRDTALAGTADAATRAFLRGHDLHWIAFAPETRFAGGRVLEAGEFEGTPSLPIVFRDELGGDVVLHVSAADSLPLGVIQTNHTGRGDPTVRVRFLGWRSLGGVRVFSVASFHQGEQVFTFRYLDLRVDETPEMALAPPRVPAPPKEVPADGRDVVRAMRAAYAGTWYRNLYIEQEVVQGGDPSEREIWTELLDLPGRVRSDIDGPGSGNCEIYRHGIQTIFRDGERIFDGKALHTVLLLGFDAYVQHPESTIVQLEANGFDLDVLHETEVEGRGAWRVGAAPGDTAAAHFTIEKDRLLFLGQAQKSRAGNLIEVQLDDYEPVGGGWVAATLAFRRNGAPVFDESYRRYRLLESIDPAVFDPDDFREAPAAWTLASPRQ